MSKENKQVDDWREIFFQPHDAPLREDVRRLGALVGEVLLDQEGEDFLEQVETLRTTAIERRKTHAGVKKLAVELEKVSARQAQAVARAFAAWFQAVNTAESVHRIRRQRDYQLDEKTTQPESLAAVLETLKANGVQADELWHWLERLTVEPVFTAHPTQAVRRSLLEKEQALVRALVDGFDQSRTPMEKAKDTERLRAALTISWQTAAASEVRPRVQDEFEQVGFYLAEPLYRVLPAFYEIFQHQLERVYGYKHPLPALIRFGSWVGGDMDGNPNVGADTMNDTLRAQRDLVLTRYRRECEQLAHMLSQTDNRVRVAEKLKVRLNEYIRRFPQAAADIRPRHHNMTYRCFLTLVAARLQATMRDAAGQAYTNAQGFAEDLRLVADSLASHHGQYAGLHAVRRLDWRVRTFGFHLARLDVRQDARVHDDVLAVLLDDERWLQRDVAARTRCLQPLAAGETAFKQAGDEASDRLKAVFTTLATTRKHYGTDATGPYIISMARSAADVLAVLALARYGGLVEEGAVPLDIAPLFETVDDLHHGAASLRALLDDPVYRAHLEKRGNRQMIMLGYSDSAKGDGILSARWSLQRAQHELMQLAASEGIELTFFHGRGGSASRGGGKVTSALMASPRGAVAGRLRMTEQGEIIHQKYGIRALALRSLEQTVGAALRASLRPRDEDPREIGWDQCMDELASISRGKYQQLVRDDDFVAYFRTATPVDVIERMALGSRPASRRSMQGVEDLRAIPWVFSWTQMRTILPAWYGIGTALEAGSQQIGEKQLAEMAHDYPFLHVLLNDVEMVLAKADMAIAEAFSQLAGSLHTRFFPRIRSEFELTRQWVLRLQGKDELLADDPRLAQSIRLRNPYVDPMSLLQVDLLKRWRADGSGDDELLRALVACVNGVSQGLKNTG